MYRKRLTIDVKARVSFLGAAFVRAFKDAVAELRDADG